ncbi:MAG: FAD-binding oxidoreductase [Deltaproteobacteria bacterium]|nr:FAD-binding oxidoreductase [Deltaproteobacteria bacterium]MBW2078104.1 FAD-binding oxidoreductase [Deltaproteobacteria bacterium]MBW2310429.1 FAD-binding oxidoreductase [Deltaproteobacteria bacterium]
MDVDIKKLAKDLSRIVGKEHVFTDKPTSVVYAKDTMPWDLEEQNIPYAVVRPANGQEVSGILRYANERLIPVHTHGSGTSLVGLARPKTNCIVLDTARMKDTRVYPERGYFEAGPGVHLAQLRKELEQHNALLPVFPGSELVATFGGTIAVNTSAHGVDAALGKPGDFILGFELVLPTGEIISTGTESTRRPAGIDPTKFFIGSEGLLGVLTLLRMRLIPLPHFQHIVASYRTTEDILDTVMEMYRQRIFPPLFFEYLDEKAAKIGYEAVGLDEPEGAVAMMRIHSWSKVGCEDRANNFLEFLKRGNPIEARIVDDPEEWKMVWGSRAEAGNYMYRLGMTFGSEITPRVDKLREAFRDAKDFILNLDSYQGNEFISFGHIGAPTIHAYAFVRTKDIPNELKKAIALEMREKSEELNIKYGGCGGEWGLTAQRVSFLKGKYEKEVYESLVKLKKALDPNDILNRGNLQGWM